MAGQPGYADRMQLDPNSSEPPYLQVANLLRRAIQAGEYRPGEALPSGPKLAERFGVSRVTVQQSMKVLKAEGLVVGRSGSGVFVRVQLDSVAGMLQAMGAPDSVALDLYGLTDKAMRRELDQLLDSMPDEARGLVVRAIRPGASHSREQAHVGKGDVIDGSGATAVEFVRAARSAGVRAVAVEILDALTFPGGSFSTLRAATSIDAGLAEGATAHEVAIGRTDATRAPGRMAWFDQEWAALESFVNGESRN